MKTEIEVKFCQVEVDDMRVRLAAAGAVCAQPMRLMRRRVFYLVDRTKDAYLRVRDEGDKVTMTYKEFDGQQGLHSAQEIEIVVSDFDAAIEMQLQAGLVPKSYQETRRETWHMSDGTEVVIDEWPWLRPFIEIEGESEEAVRTAANSLGFDWGDAVFGAATAAYRQQYTHLSDDFIMDQLPEIRFDAPVPEQLQI